MRIAIVEDNVSCASYLEQQLKIYQREHNEIIELFFFRNGLNFIEDYAADFDIVFMDIEMPLLNGIEAAKRLRELDKNVSIVFLTRHMQYALSGYEVDADAFLLKPVEYDKLAQAINKINKKNIANKQAFITITSKEGIVRIAHRDIIYVESFNHWCVFHTVSGKEHHMLISMKKVEKMLSQSGFLRCNNSYLVNVTYVTGWNKSSVVLGNITLPISRGKRKKFLDDLTKMYGEI